MSIVNLSHQTDDSLTCVYCSGVFLYFVVMLVNFKEFVTKQYADCQQHLWLLSLLYITLSATTAYRSVVALWLITEACWFKSPYVIMNMMTILSQMAVKTVDCITAKETMQNCIFTVSCGESTSMVSHRWQNVCADWNPCWLDYAEMVDPASAVQ